MRRTYIFKIETDDFYALQNLLDDLDYVEYFEFVDEEITLDYGDVIIVHSTCDTLMRRQTGALCEWYSSLFDNSYSDLDVLEWLKIDKAKFLVKNGEPVTE